MSRGQLKDNRSLIGQILLRIVKLLNIVIITIPFAFIWYGFYTKLMLDAFYQNGNWIIIALFVIFYCMFVRVYDALALSYDRISDLIFSQILSAFLSDFFMYLIIILLVRSYTVNPLPLLIAFCFQILYSIIWSKLSHIWFFQSFDRKKAIVIYDEEEGMENLINEYGFDAKFDVVNVYHVDHIVNNLHNLSRVNTVFLSGIHSTSRNKIIKYCVANNISVFMIPRIGDTLMSGSHRMHMLHLPMLRLERYNPSPEYLFVKRAFDIIVSLLGIIILSPLMTITAIAIKSDGGPALYKQVRLTKDGREFKILKFRSMKVDAEKDGVARLSSGENDDRITKVGHIIRAIRFDELPQLFNILFGDMTIVGPRPERPEIAKQYYEELPEFELRLQAKAGLTGYAQVYGKYNTTPYNKLLMDLMYISHPSVLQDLAIMFSTVKILFMKDSTEGIAEGQTTAAQ